MSTSKRSGRSGGKSVGGGRIRLLLGLAAVVVGASAVEVLAVEGTVREVSDGGMVAVDTMLSVADTTLRATDTIFYVGGVPIEMVFVKGGTFMMGCTPEQGGDCDSNAKPAHSGSVGNFHIGRYEVTQRLWTAVMVMDSNPSHFKGDDLPVENVSWDMVQKFIGKLNQQTGKEYRLPTEAEWEYAARGGNKSGRYKYSGSNNIDKVAWYGSNSGDRTHPVGTKSPNELGIHDMSGNVWEWVSDWFGGYTKEAKENPTGPSGGSFRVYRGGSLPGAPRICQVSFRSNSPPYTRNGFLGFRLVLSSP